MPGKLYIVGVGPGHHDHMTFRAKQVIEESDTIVGYETYVNLLRGVILISPHQLYSVLNFMFILLKN